MYICSDLVMFVVVRLQVKEFLPEKLLSVFILNLAKFDRFKNSNHKI